jgi:hypothetical protein
VIVGNLEWGYSLVTASVIEFMLIFLLQANPMNELGLNLYTLAQALGFITFGCSIAAFSSTNDHRFRVFLTLGCLLLAIQYGILGALVAGVNLAINSVRALWSIKYRGAIWFWVFMILQTGLSVLVYKSPIDLLPWTASAISCYALFFLSGRAMRTAMLLCTCVWLVNSVMVGTYGAILNDLFNISVMSLTLFRMSRVKVPA